MSHQLKIFGFQPPKKKIPISAEKIRKAKALFEAGDEKGSAEMLREVREGLERLEKRIHSKRK